MPSVFARHIQFAAILSAAVSVWGSTCSAQQVNTETSVGVQVITARDISDLPLCGRVFTDLVNITPAPALTVTKGEVKVPTAANGPEILDKLNLQFGQGDVQPANQPFCVNGIDALKQALTFYYGNSTAGVIHLNPKPSTSPYIFTSLPGAASNYFMPPILLPGEVQTIRGPFTGPSTVDVNGLPGLVLAQTPSSLYWMLPENAPHNSVMITVRNGGNGAKFPAYILGLAMSADRLHLLRGESTPLRATVFGPELMPESAWTAGPVSDVIDPVKLKELFPTFTPPKPGEPGVLFFRLDNASRQTVSMSPSTNQSFSTVLNRSNFASGPYSYTGTIQSFKTGNFTINGIVVAFFAPIPGIPLQPPVVAEVPKTPAEVPKTATETPKTPAEAPVTISSAEPCPKKGDDCAELRRKAEQLEAEAAAARASQPAISDQQSKLSEAAAIDRGAANSLAFAAKLKQQAQAYRDLAQTARDAAKKDRERAAENPPGSKIRDFWEKEAEIDDKRGDEYEKEALRLEADAVIEEARAAADSKTATGLRAGIDPSKLSDLEAKIKAAADARAAYNECLNKANKDCPVKPGKYSLSTGLSYNWDKPRIGPNWPPLPGGGMGGGIKIQIKDQPPPDVLVPPTHGTSQQSEEKCKYALTDGWFEPTQGVWQDDPKFEDRPGKQLTRLDIPGVISYIAELPMVKDRDTVITGVHHYELNGKPVILDQRIWVVMKGLSNCSELDSVDMTFSVQGPAGGAGFKIPGGRIPMHGKKLPEMRPWDVSELTYTGLPANQTFKFSGTGPYTIVMDIAGMQVRVSGNVLETHGPIVHFIPVVLQAGGPDNILDFTTRKLAKDSAKFLPDLLPLRPGGLPTQAHALKDFSKEDIPGVWDFGLLYRKQDKLLSLVQDHLGTSAFLTGAGRVVAVLNVADFVMLEGSGVAGVAPKGSFTIGETGATLSQKVILIPRSSDIGVVGHELTHTLPGLWSSDGMVAECGIDYHNKDMSLANGLRLVVGGTPSARRNKDRSTPLMGPHYGAQDEDLTNPLTADGKSERTVKNPETGQMENQFIFERWITQCTYRHLANVLQTPPDPRMLLVRGYLGRRDGKYGGHLNAFYDVMGNEDLPEDFIGDFAIVLKDSGGKELARYKFAPDWKLPGYEFTRDLTAFHFRVPLKAGLARIELQGPQGILDWKELSPEAPKVEITSPFEGDRVMPRGDQVLISWAGSAGAGKPLLYTLLYSADGGETWDDRIFETTAKMGQVQLGEGAGKHAVKIIATDGTRSAEAVVHFEIQ